ncbi:MAG TPA: CRISPR-associated endoribonuclease Cas6 [Tepiditoga sp.]|nr:CRISPR-associated endoribonuclease Cas6 [Tepiditoga sp.]
MRIKLTLENKRGIHLPTNYKYLFQSYIYNSFNEINNFHDEGLFFQKKNLKPFCFSDIISKNISVENKIINFGTSAEIFISSPVELLMDLIIKNVLKEKYIRIGSENIKVKNVSATPYIFSNEIIVKTISPITIYKINQDKSTTYYSPGENLFFSILQKNFSTKLNFFRIPDETFKITSEKYNPKDEKIIMYKNNFIIKAWKGLYRIKGSSESINLALDWGIGMKNSAGFGMIQPVKYF